MKAAIFGATGMVGQGVLRECLLNADVDAVLSIGRGATGQRHAKLREAAHEDFTDFAAIEDQWRGYDACFYCLGVSSVGMNELAYRRVTYDFTMAAARTLAALNPGMTFVYVSGAGADSSGRARSMWARVKGETENALLELPFRAAYMFRPGFIQPLHGIRSRTALYRVLYTSMGPFIPLLTAVLPDYITTTEKVGRAMIAAARTGAPARVLENRDINRMAR